jgi:hypothetical protein
MHVLSGCAGRIGAQDTAMPAPLYCMLMQLLQLLCAEYAHSSGVHEYSSAAC